MVGRLCADDLGRFTSSEKLSHPICIDPTKCLANRQEMIGKTMTLKERRKAHMPLDKDGKPIRPYTNLSASMNNVMSQAKKKLLNFSNKGKNENLSKLEFTKHVFEEIHERQMREVGTVWLKRRIPVG